MAPPPGQLLSGIRVGVGVASYVAPALTGKLFGFDTAANPQATVMARLFGIRDVVLGVGTRATAGPQQALWWKLGIACDLADVGAAVLAQRDGTIPTLTAVMFGATALTAAGLGVAALQAEA